LLRSLLRLLRARPTHEPTSSVAPARTAAASRATGTDARREWLADIADFLSTAPVPIALIGLDHRLLAWNSAFATLTGRSSDSLTDRSIEEMIDDEGCEWLRRQLHADQGEQAGARFGRVRMTVNPDAEMLITGSQFLEHGAVAGWYLRFNADPSVVFDDPSVQGLVERVSREKERLAALLTVSHAVVNSLDLDTILATIAQQVRQVIEVDECTVFLIDAAGETLVPAVCDAARFRDEMMSMRLRVGEGITGTVAKTGRGEIVHSAEDDPRAAHVPGTPPEQSSLMCVPMIAREKVQGVITLARLGSRSFERTDLELATLFAGQCSTALANARIYDELRRAYDEVRETQAQLVQSAKLNALGEMAAGVAHDFNNILAAILGRTQLMIRDAQDPELKRQLLVVQQAALDGAQTVRRVQEFTRIRHDEHFAGLDVNPVITDVVELTRMVWETDAKKHGTTVNMRLSLAATQPIAGNASELREVFTNLILNAVDAMPWGGDLFVSSEDGAGEVVIRVRDTGVGMDPQTRSRIFDPFFTTKAAKGTGLGLSVAYGIVTRHRGAITVDSEPRVGTEFVLHFPCGDLPEATPTRSPVAGSTPSHRVLVVDDEEPVLSVISELLTDLGQQVTTAVGGREGLEQLERTDPQIVFSDLGMPEVNGWDLAAAVRARGSETVMVLVTGWGSQIESGTAQARGVDLVLSKPFSLEDVERALVVAADLLAQRRQAA
jgi:signal transduction histidine kinase/ActR/RegA family two-component response regulator/PAS domain-containing protein